MACGKGGTSAKANDKRAQKLQTGGTGHRGGNPKGAGMKSTPRKVTPNGNRGGTVARR
jgi:hypothetical protein